MNQQDLEKRLRPLRRALVTEAEAVILRAFNGGDAMRPPAKTQFSRLVNVCGEATCAEEIENYLRYQAGRDVKSKGVNTKEDAWRVDFVEAMIEGLGKAFGHGVEGSAELSQEARDLSGVEAWRLYATYLTRAFTYQDAIRRQNQPRSQDRGQRR